MHKCVNSIYMAVRIYNWTCEVSLYCFADLHAIDSEVSWTDHLANKRAGDREQTRIYTNQRGAMRKVGNLLSLVLISAVGHQVKHLEVHGTLSLAPAQARAGLRQGLGSNSHTTT